MSSPPGAGPFGELLGARLVREGAGESEVAFEATPRHANKYGVLHGGVQMSLLDMAMGAATVTTLAPDETTASVTITTEFLRGGGTGALVARGRVTKRGKTLVFVEGALADAKGEALARATGIWSIRPTRQR